MTIEYTVHFQRGSRIGTRSLRMVPVEATDPKEAIRKAKAQFHEPGYRVVRVDHMEGYHIMIDI